MTDTPDTMPLHVKLRPSRIDSPGMAPTTDLAALKLVWDSTTRPHVWAFAGDSGCGKTTTARALAVSLENEYRAEIGDENARILIREINVADRTGVDFARELVEQATRVTLSPIVTILDEAHKLTDAAQNALLKLLEDTPEKHYYFICTTDYQKLIKAVQNRCKLVKYSPLSKAQTFHWTQLVCGHLKWPAPSLDVATAIWQEAGGSPRKILQLLDAWHTTGKVEAEPELVGELPIPELAKLLLRGQSRWRADISPLLKEKSYDPEGARRALSGYLLGVLFNAETPETAKATLKALATMTEPIYSTGRDAVANFVVKVYLAWEAYKK